MSAYWNFVTTMVPATLAKAEDVNTNLSGIDTGFTLVEAEINKCFQITNSPGVVDIGLNAAARANKLVSFDVNGDIAASQILGDWKGDHADAAGTDYEIRDVVKDAAAAIGQDNLYICNTTHTSTGDLATDTANWDLLVEVSGVAASAAAALVSENNAATSADFLDDRVLGSFSTVNEPTLDNDGGALLTGAQYFNTDLDRMKVYTGSVWQLNTAAAADVTIADSGAIYTATDAEAALQEVKLLADASTTKLAGIESGADVTDTTNVTAAGALMDSEVDADIKTLSLPASTTISAYGKTLVDDANAAAAIVTLGITATASEVNAVCDGKTLASTDDVIDNFPAGTRMLFQQTAAPVGWTKQTTHNNKALRVVSGSVVNGGATPFTTVFGSSKTAGSHAITTAQMPSHIHSESNYLDNKGSCGTAGAQSYKYISYMGCSENQISGTGTWAGGASAGSGNTHNHTLSLDLQYVDLIIASKD
jgi:hypothetical protein